MSTATRSTQKIDDLMEKASALLASQSYFESERQSVKALQMARDVSDFERMARICLPLQEARRQRVQIAMDHPEVHVIDEPFGEDTKIEPGVYLIQPMMVGADARRLRLAAFEQDVPVLVACREPRTDLGLIPVVAITSGLTMRWKVRAPKDESQPDVAWVMNAIEELGDSSIEMLDADLAPLRRVDALMLRLDALPEHEKLHQALADACRVMAQGENEK